MQPTYQSDIYESAFPGHGSRLVYGTSGLGGVWGAIDEEESVACLLYGFDNGITSVDTAPSYNRAEEIVGKALRRWRGTRPFISTKIGRLKSEDPFHMILDYSPQGLSDSLHRSLDLLGTAKIDLLFLHEPHLAPLDRMDEILETLQSFREGGLVGMLGVGGNPTPAFMPYIKPENFGVVSGYCRLDACNLSVYELEMPQYQANGIYYYAAAALHFALLGDGFPRFVQEAPAGDLARFITPADIARARQVNDLASRYGLSLSSLAQRFLFSVREATRVVMGAKTISQIEATIADWRQGALEEGLFGEIVGIAQGEAVGRGD